MARAPKAAPAPEVETAAEAAQSTGVMKIEDIKPENAPAIFGHGKLSDFVAHVRASIVDEVPDLSTDAGRKRVASLAYDVRKSKSALDKHGRDYLRNLKGLPKIIEVELRVFGEEMDALAEQIRKPLTELEQKEKAEKARIEANIQVLIDGRTILEEHTAEYLAERLAYVQGLKMTAKLYGTRIDEATEYRDRAVAALEPAIARRREAERLAAENVRLQREADARAEQDRIRQAAEKAVKDERDRVENQRKQDLENERLRQEQAERKAQDERDRVENQRKQELEQERQRTAQAEQAVKDANLRTEQAAQRERDRIAHEERKKLAADQARAADVEHRGSTNRAALAALMELNVSGDAAVVSTLNEVEAKAVLTAIIRGLVPNVSIAY